MLLGEPYPELIQCLCQCLNGLHVQVICWLIQDVEVWTGREDSSEAAVKYSGWACTLTAALAA